jgi:hypothetical protein
MCNLVVARQVLRDLMWACADLIRVSCPRSGRSQSSTQRGPAVGACS